MFSSHSHIMQVILVFQFLAAQYSCTLQMFNSSFNQGSKLQIDVEAVKKSLFQNPSECFVSCISNFFLIIIISSLMGNKCIVDLWLSARQSANFFFCKISSHFRSMQRTLYEPAAAGKMLLPCAIIQARVHICSTTAA